MKPAGFFAIFASVMLTCFTHGNEADRLFYEAVRVEDNGSLEDAIASYEEATAHAHSANLHGNLANLYFKMANHGKAILHYRKALLLDPDNQELKANLAHVRGVAGIPSPATTADDSYFAPTTTNTWCWITMILFWIGLLGGLFFLRAILPNSLKAVVVTIWATVVAFGSYAAWRADRNTTLLNREAVAVATNTSAKGEERQLIRLRRYAGDSNEANAELKPGEIVRIDVGDESNLKKHVTPDGTIWLLARSRLGGKKGWATSKELMKILD